MKGREKLNFMKFVLSHSVPIENGASLLEKAMGNLPTIARHDGI